MDRKKLCTIIQDFECISYSKYKKYDLAYRYFKKFDMMTSLPVIVISAITGSVNFSSTFENSNVYSTVVSSLNIFCAALLGIGRYLNLNDVKIKNKSSMNEYEMLFRYIYTRLNQINESTSENEIKNILEEIEERYNNITKTAVPLPMFINDKKFDINTDENNVMRIHRSNDSFDV